MEHEQNPQDMEQHQQLQQKEDETAVSQTSTSVATTAGSELTPTPTQQAANTASTSAAPPTPSSLLANLPPGVNLGGLSSASGHAGSPQGGHISPQPPQLHQPTTIPNLATASGAQQQMPDSLMNQDILCIVVEQQRRIFQLEEELQRSKFHIDKLQQQISALESEKQKHQKSKQSRYWTPEEHQKFLEALEKFGRKDVKAISQYVGTRNPTQVRTHAQKYYLKLERDNMKKAGILTPGKASPPGSPLVAPMDTSADAGITDLNLAPNSLNASTSSAAHAPGTTMRTPTKAGGPLLPQGMVATGLPMTPSTPVNNNNVAHHAHINPQMLQQHPGMIMAAQSPTTTSTTITQQQQQQQQRPSTPQQQHQQLQQQQQPQPQQQQQPQAVPQQQ